jgi:magnesium transporter
VLRLEELRVNLDPVFREADADTLKNKLVGIHPADLVTILRDYDKNIQAQVFHCLEDFDAQLEVLMFADSTLGPYLFSLLAPEQQAEVVREMPTDEAADLVKDLGDEAADILLKSLDSQTAGQIRDLKRYHDNTAGALMTPDFLRVQAHAKIQDVIKILATNEDLESIDTGFVLTEAGKILGSFYVQELLVHKGNPFVIQFLDEDVLTVDDTASDEDVYHMMSRHGLDILPVVNHAGQMLGIITADDVLDVARQASEKAILQMVGTSGDFQKHNPFVRAAHRIPWLIFTLMGGIVSGFIIKGFSVALHQFTLLMMLMPFANAMAGNVGLQSSTIIVRDLANMDRIASHVLKNISREMLTGVVNAVFFGTLISVIIFIYGYLAGFDGLIAGSSIGIALFCSISFAGVLGAIIPIWFNRLGIDPAISSGPVITMTMDIVGLTIYLSISTWLFYFARFNGNKTLGDISKKAEHTNTLLL